MWADTPGGRERVFCKKCLMEGREWLTREPCEHILMATGWEATMEQAQDLLSQEVGGANPDIGATGVVRNS